MSPDQLDLALARRERETLQRQLKEATVKVRDLAVQAVQNGETELGTALRAGVARSVLRGWLGK